jgi:hypothetical protein
MFTQFYIEDYFSPGRAILYLHMIPRCVFMLRWVQRMKYSEGHSVSFTLYDLVKEGIFDVMPRTRRTPTADRPKPHVPPQPASDGQIVWCNVKLSDDDIAYLTELGTTFDELGAKLLAVADNGQNFSVKRLTGEQSIMCAITGVCTDNSGRLMGVSAFSDNVRDATLACLYKFEHLLGGSFGPEHLLSNNIRPRFR